MITQRGGGHRAAFGDDLDEDIGVGSLIGRDGGGLEYLDEGRPSAYAAHPSPLARTPSLSHGCWRRTILTSSLFGCDNLAELEVGQGCRGVVGAAQGQADHHIRVFAGLDGWGERLPQNLGLGPACEPLLQRPPTSVAMRQVAAGFAGAQPPTAAVGERRLSVRVGPGSNSLPRQHRGDPAALMRTVKSEFRGVLSIWSRRGQALCEAPRWTPCV